MKSVFDWSLIPFVNLVILVLMITLMEFSTFNRAPKQFKSKGIIENYSSLSKEKRVHLVQWMCSTRCAIPSGTRRKCKGVLQHLMENARQDYYKRVYSYFQGFWYQRFISLEYKVDFHCCIIFTFVREFHVRTFGDVTEIWRFVIFVFLQPQRKRHLNKSRLAVVAVAVECWPIHLYRQPSWIKTNDVEIPTTIHLNYACFVILSYFNKLSGA